MFVTWNQLADALQSVIGFKPMTSAPFRSPLGPGDRQCYEAVIAHLREAPLAGRKCTGCGGPLMEKRLANVCDRFDYDCTCDGRKGLDKAEGWKVYEAREYERVGGIEIG